jgi:23S rRNA-/tRNA-specific pseudouridylate synthase
MVNNTTFKTLEVLFVDNHFLVLHKPAGLLVQADRTTDASLLEIGREYIKKRFNKPGNVFLGLAACRREKFTRMFLQLFRC